MNYIKGLQCFYDDETEGFFYCNEKMFKEGIAIECRTLIFGPGDVQTWIDVVFLNKVADIEVDACSYTLYSDNLLSDIQIYRIIKDIYEFYCNNKVTDFIDIMNDMSVSRISSSMQSIPNNGESIRLRIKETFDFIESEGFGQMNS